MEDFVTTKEAAEILGVTPGRVRAMIGKGRLPAKTVGTGPRSVHIIARADLEAVKIRKPGRPASEKPVEQPAAPASAKPGKPAAGAKAGKGKGPGPKGKSRGKGEKS